MVKQIKKIMTSIMLLMLMFQAFFSPVVAVAETNELKDEEKNSLELNQMKLIENEEDYAVVMVEMTTKNESENEQTHKLTTSLPVEVADEVEENNITTKVDEEGRKVEVTVAPDTKTKFDLKLKVKKEDTNEQTLVVTNDKQDKKLVIPSVATEESSEETKKEDNTKESTSDTEEKQEKTEKTKKEDKQTTEEKEETKESTTETEEKVTKDTKEKQPETEKTKEEDKQGIEEKEETKESTTETEEKETKDTKGKQEETEKAKEEDKQTTEDKGSTKEGASDKKEKTTKNTIGKQNDREKVKEVEDKKDIGDIIAKTTAVPAFTSVLVNIVWEDNNNQDGKRPNQVIVQIKNNGQVLKDFLITAGIDKWQRRIDRVPFRNFYIIGISGVAGYELVESKSSVTGSGTNLRAVATLKHTPSKTSVNVEKKWDDNQDKNGQRPNSVKVSLKADGKSTGKTVTLNKNNNWKGNFTNLDEYKNGKKINYTVQEADIKGYEAKYNYTEGKPKKAVITNSQTRTSYKAKATVDWEDNNDQDGIRPTSLTIAIHEGKNASEGGEIRKKVTLTKDDNWEKTFPYSVFKGGGAYLSYEDMPDGYKEDSFSWIWDSSSKQWNIHIVLKHTPSKTNVNVEKKWNDFQNQDGKRPNSVKVSLKADGKLTGKTLTLNKSDDWKGSFDNLDEYKNGKKINYTVEEANVNGYTANYNYTEGKPKKAVITNTHYRTRIGMNVEKEWDDDDDRDGLRPDSVKMFLKADGKSIGKTVTLNKDNNWQGAIGNLDKYKNGKEIKYSFEEEKVDGYESEVVQKDSNHFVVTNYHEPTKKKTLDFLSAPKQLDFGQDLKITTKDKSYPLKQKDDDLKVQDSRGSGNHWRMTATLTQELTSPKGHQLVDSLFYKKDGQNLPFVQGESIPIYEKETKNDDVIKISDEWSGVKNGPVLEVAAGKAYPESYVGGIQWTLQDVPGVRRIKG